MKSLDAVQFHDSVAERWEANYARPSFGRRADTLMCMAGEGALGEQLWLDAGCGSGTIARLLARRGARVTAVDASEAMVRVAHGLMQCEEYAIAPYCLRIGDVATLPFADATFDGVMCSSVLEYVRDPRCALDEMARVLRPGGRLVVSVPNRSGCVRRLQKAAFCVTKALGRSPWPGYISLSRHEYTARDCRSLLNKHGFVVRELKYYGPALPRWLADTRYGGTLLLAAAVRNSTPTRAAGPTA